MLTKVISFLKEHILPSRVTRFFSGIDAVDPIIDVVDIEISNCNLKCAMCPRADVYGLKNTKKGIMDIGLFKKIIDKFLAENIRFKILWFGDWGEPLLNPFFADMVRYSKSKMPDIRIIAYTNLTYLKDPAEIVASGLDDLEVSISGMSQEVHSKNHIGGDVDAVLSNLKKLAYFKKQMNSNINLIMKFHDYVYNKEDAELGRKFCENNGLAFKLLRCYIPCVEANIAFHKNKDKWIKYYRQFIDMEREVCLMKTLEDYRWCWWRKHTVVINLDGQLYRCTGLYDEKYLLGSFFNYKIRDIQKIKSRICELCGKTPMSWR